ncbi:MAG: hypothetical protein ABSF69_14555 [Polyangiaceae bacterium]
MSTVTVLGVAPPSPSESAAPPSVPLDPDPLDVAPEEELPDDDPADDGPLEVAPEEDASPDEDAPPDDWLLGERATDEDAPVAYAVASGVVPSADDGGDP